MSSEMSTFALTIARERYMHDGETSWEQVANRVATHVIGAVPDQSRFVRSWLLPEAARLIRERKFMPGGRYLYSTGRPFHQVQNCLLLRAEDSREGWGELSKKVEIALMTGAGLGVVYTPLRAEGAPLGRTGGFSSGPLAKMQIVNEIGRGAMQGGSRRAAMWAGLHWNHPDIFKFITQKDWSLEVRALKEKNQSFPATMDHTNISVILDDEFFRQYKLGNIHAREVYLRTTDRMLRTGEPGFSVDVGANAGEDLRNACTEITSADDSDICNLGSVNLAQIANLNEFRLAVAVGTAFLLAGTIYSDVPYQKVDEVRKKNRRIGLGLMGLHEWLLKRGKHYEPDKELATWLSVYADQSRREADAWADAWGISRPVKVRAVAPTGTIGIVAETTTGVEPIFCTAYKRRYFKTGRWLHQMVLDPTAKRLVNQGVDPESIEDAYSIGADRRLEFQAWLQRYVDHAISSTLNLPAWNSPANNPDTMDRYRATIMEHMYNLRGVTVYPDGARGGQPITPVPWKEAEAEVGKVFEGADVCDLRGGSCGA